MCLLRGTNWIFKQKVLRFVHEVLNRLSPITYCHIPTNALIIIIIIIIIGIQPLGRSGQRPELSQATGMALVRCNLGKFLGVVCHCFPPCTNYIIYYLKSVLIIDVKTLSYFHSSYMFRHITCHPQGALMFLAKNHW
jgi:hypothetical protein